MAFASGRRVTKENYIKVQDISFYMVRTGVHFVQNGLKFVTMHVLFKNNAFSKETAMTCRELSNITGITLQKFSDLMIRCHKNKYGYFRRTKPKGGKDPKDKKAYQYYITKKGVKYYLKYCHRIHNGFDLNLQAKKPTHMARYAEITAKRHKEWHDAHIVLDKTGIWKDPRKKTVTELTDISIDDLKDYVHISRFGALEMNITEDKKLVAAGFNV